MLSALHGVKNFSDGVLWTQNRAIVSERLQGAVKSDALTYQVILSGIFAKQFDQVLRSKGWAMPTLIYIGIVLSPLVIYLASERKYSEKNKKRLNDAVYQYSSWVALATYTVLAANLLFKNYQFFLSFVLGMGTKTLLSQPRVQAFIGDEYDGKFIRSLEVTSSLLTFMAAEGVSMSLFSLYFNILPIIQDGVNFVAECYPQLISVYQHPVIEKKRDKTLQDFIDGKVDFKNLVIDPGHFTKEVKGLEVNDLGLFHEQLDQLRQVAKKIDWGETLQVDSEIDYKSFQMIPKVKGKTTAVLLAFAINSCDQAKDSNFVEDAKMFIFLEGAYKKQDLENRKSFFLEGLEILCWRFKKKGAEIRGEVFQENEPTLAIRTKKGLARDIVCTNMVEFKKLEKMLEEITQYIVDNPKKEESIRALISLGVYGNYCGIRIFDVVQRVHHGLFEESLGADKLLDHDLDKYQEQFLYSIEEKLTQTPCSEYFSMKTFSNIIANVLFLGSYWEHFFETRESKGTPHNQEYFRYLYGGPIGLSLKKVFMDQGTHLPKRLPHWKSIHEESQRFYTEHYTPEALTQRYQEANRILYSHLKEWFQKQGCRDEEEYFDVVEGTWKPGAIEYFLYKNGVLGIKKL